MRKKTFIFAQEGAETRRFQLSIDYQLGKPKKNVRVLIMLSDEMEEAQDEKLWVESISKNTAFDFLAEESENIYSISDGEPLRDCIRL